MITHVVLFRPLASFGPDELQAVFETVVNGIRRCPTVRAFRIGRRILHGRAGYEQGMREDYQYLLILDFDDVQGLTSYLDHPEHVKLGSLFSGASASALAYDYDLLPVDSAGLR